jgi:hypothetical protein
LATVIGRRISIIPPAQSCGRCTPFMTTATKKMLRQELQLYFDRVYPFSKVDKPNSLHGQINIRFELGEKQSNGTVERVNQATTRAEALFNDIFDNPRSEIFVLIYEYAEANSFNASNEYLHKQFPSNLFEEFDSEVLGKNEMKVIIGKLPVKDIKIYNILNGIANTEMGFEPAIDQKIFFFDQVTDKAFHMYDDRGCIIWSDTADKIRDIYIKRNEWIVDNYRPEIEKYIK